MRRLFALDAKTGKPCKTFANNGQIDPREHMGPVPPGVVRAFDAVSEAPFWSWDIGKTPAKRKLAPDETYTRGTPNGWGVWTDDPGLNLVYVPLGSPTPDYFGGERGPSTMPVRVHWLRSILQLAPSAGISRKCTTIRGIAPFPQRSSTCRIGTTASQPR